MMPTPLDDPSALVRSRRPRRTFAAVRSRDAVPSGGTGGLIAAFAPPALPHFHGP
ncbi:hypothetical protein FBZ84_110212 [Azospirillum baldaniorum]|uniref:hypothetical protein n=1 Tax=Azospirillum baldaniorum TaxID=1064539 RepID=UPI0011ABD72D|nr:hypothetical protein [Azospirillum baldaniorum]TWA63689.1 hypothetical protein FBZ84_110212 [Azospirillum baldaniorum]